MITFGYNGRFSSPIRALLFVAMGVFMIVAKADAMQMVVKIFAAFILAAGVVSVFVGFKQKKAGTMPLSFFNALINIVIAGLLFVFAPIVSKFVSYLLGFVLFGFGLFQLSVLLSMRKSVKISFVAYLLPVLVTIAGLLIFFYPGFFGKSLGLIAGIALIVYGASDLISAFKMKGAKGSEEVASGSETQAETQSDPMEAKEVEYEKVDEQ
ncbi:MAG: DUF308 domain-containing protein [Bacteroidales bacterium]|nr:DUF308 domain-containing protein [Bacteroidales bacterium]